jgi:hypothetical protein
MFYWGIGRIVGLLLLGCGGVATCQSQYHQPSSGSASYSTANAPMPLDQVVRKLEERNAQRAAALVEFTSRRVYRMQYRGFPGDRYAEMVVEVTYHAPNAKEFRVVSQSGSTFLVDHIFRRLMESEQEFLNHENFQHDAMTTANYDFTFAGYEATPDGAQYVLNILPKSKNRFLYRGKIWVDAKDFAVVRIQGEPARNPSLWIKNTEVDHKYEKVNDFWLPAENHTESTIRMGGRAVLSIEYKDYKITKVANLPGNSAYKASK